MLNVIFYSEPKTRTVSRTSYDRNGTIVTVEVKEVYHSPKSYSCQTMTCGEGLFFEDKDITFFNGSMKSLTNANSMFEGTFIEYFSHDDEQADFSSVTTAERMFAECRPLETVKGKFTSLKNAKEMFYNCPSVTTWECEWSDCIRVGSGMFYNCEGLTEFTGELSELEQGDWMFAQTGLTTFSGDLGSLRNGENMFLNCYELTSIISDLSRLKNGNSMFQGCELTTFQCPLTSLESAEYMFDSCRLTPQSVMFILDSIPTHISGEHKIGIGIACANTEDAKNVFAEQAGYNDWQTMTNYVTDKGWTVTWQFNN